MFYFLLSFTEINSQDIKVIPAPNSMIAGKGNFIFGKETYLLVDQNNADLMLAIQPLLDKFKTAAGITLKYASNKSVRNLVSFQLSPSVQSAQGYELDVTTTKISVKAKNAVGIFSAVQTLLQLLPSQIESNVKNSTISWKVPVVTIVDAPAFQYRGLMIDVARHFMPATFIKKLIDLMAMQKMNNLHLHLTDDQGWRIEIKKYPRLTSLGGYRNGTIQGKYPGTGSDNTTYGGFYTQEEIIDLVRYAKNRFIEIVPEIELPGHASAAIAAYPALSCFPFEPTDTLPNMMSKHSLDMIVNNKAKVVQETWGVFQDVFAPTEFTFNFLQDVLDEVMILFPSKFIHIGGDECPKEFWKRSEYCQQMIKQYGLIDEHGLQSYFIQRIEKYINSNGRQIIGWDEILEGGLAPNATVMSWRGIVGGTEAAKQGHDAIMTPIDFCYLNFYQSEDPSDSIAWGGLLKLKSVYGYQPIPASLDSIQAKHIIGVQGNLWTEYIKTTELTEYMLFPRAIALAEIGWTKKREDFTNFTDRLLPYLDRLKFKKVNYSRHMYDITFSSKYDLSTKNIAVSIGGAPKENTLFYTMSSSLNKESLTPYVLPIGINSSTTLTALVKVNGEIVDNVSISYTLNKATGKSLSLQKEPAKQYSKGGAEALLNGIVGNYGRFNDNEWLGWNGDDFSGTISFGNIESVQDVSLRFFSQPSSWIYMPSQVKLYGSADGVNYFELGSKSEFDQVKNGAQIVKFNFKNQNLKFIKVSATNFGIIPKGEQGTGNLAWLFVGEIEVH